MCGQLNLKLLPIEVGSLTVLGVVVSIVSPPQPLLVHCILPQMCLLTCLADSATEVHPSGAQFLELGL